MPPPPSVRRLDLTGPEASGAVISGGVYGSPDVPVTTAEPTIGVWSQKTESGWAPPSDIILRDLEIHGAVRLWGMGSGEDRYADLRRSSRSLDHVAQARAAAPRRVLIENVSFHAAGSIALYIGPGCTQITVRHCRFLGRSDATAVYLDAESGECEISDCDFQLKTGREVIAVDGSADNLIVRNRFRLRWHGAVHIYRNCGERGVIRHQTPSGNRIEGNRIHYARPVRPKPVVLGSRQGRQTYCSEDAGFPFGSSIDDGDRTENNLVGDNVVA